MSDIDIREVLEMDHHRNGICGEPFKVAVYSAKVEGRVRLMVTVRFYDDKPDANGESVLSVTRTCTFDVDSLKGGNVKFAMGNSWRGDQFAEATKAADIFKEDEA